MSSQEQAPASTGGSAPKGKCPVAHGGSNTNGSGGEGGASSASRCPYLRDKAQAPSVPSDHPPVADASQASIGATAGDVRDSRDDTDGVDVHDASAVTAAPDAIKKHFATRYNAVSANGRQKPSAARVELARRSQAKIGYTEEELAIIGDDVAIMQGVNNPHHAAKYKLGDVVVDLGCGMGVDTRIAAARVGPSGRAIGIDLSQGEVSVAMERARDLKLTNVDYRVADMEELPFPDASTDVVISNGGFCLVPNKDKAFREIFRVLRPGGRISIACTVRRQLLKDGVRWPVCMNTFMLQSDIVPLLTSIGYADVAVDVSNSRMDAQEVQEDDIEAAAKAAGVCTHAIRAQLRRRAQHGSGGAAGAGESKEGQKESDGTVSKRATVHTGESQFAHLRNYDMSELCARVIISATKPGTASSACASPSPWPLRLATGAAAVAAFAVVAVVVSKVVQRARR